MVKSPIEIIIELFLGLIDSASYTLVFIFEKFLELFVSLSYYFGTGLLSIFLISTILATIFVILKKQIFGSIFIIIFSILIVLAIIFAVSIIIGIK